MTIDADTRVAPDSIPHMVYSGVDEDKNILACCGETQVDNKAQSWVTMIQVFEYYSNRHMKKACSGASLVCLDALRCTGFSQKT
jgi:chitin synthase